MPGRSATYKQAWALITCLCAWSARASASDAGLGIAPIPSPAQTAAAALALQADTNARSAPVASEDSSLFESPWFWVGVAGAVATSVAIALVVANSGDDPEVPKGTLNLSVSVLTKAPCTSTEPQR